MGAYRVKSVHKLGSLLWCFRPYDDGWVRIDHPGAERPLFDHIPGRTKLRAVGPTTAKRSLEDAAALVARADVADVDDGMRRRLENFVANFDAWRAIAAERSAPLLAGFGMDLEPLPVVADDEPFNPALAGLRKMTPSSEGPAVSPPDEAPVEPAPPRVEPASTTAPSSGTEDRGPEASPHVIDSSLMTRLQQDYGNETAKRVALGTLTKPMLVLRGHPGVGKSRLAVMLMDDPERRMIVAVASTWRGREDLLGYVNPVNGEFEPTGFCDFLDRAAKAWNGGDRRPRLVVFEEFNLSPPEFWLSDLLVRMQYPEDDVAARTVDLGGRRVRGWERDESTVFISPALLFVGTMNVDHTTRPLSPRVLDRASVVTIDLDPVRALRQAGLKLDDDQVEAIRGLDNVLRDKAATFSVRTAQSLGRCLANAERLEMTTWDCLDVVLIQEVFSKLRIAAGDPVDAGVVVSLRKWADDYGEELPLFQTHVDDMHGRTQSGLDSL